MTITHLPYPVLFDVQHDSQANFEVIDGHLDDLGGTSGALLSVQQAHTTELAAHASELAADATELADHASKLSQLDWLRTTFATGTGAPTSTPAQTTFYFRTDTPSVAGQRIYVFDPSGGTWNSLA